MWVSYWLRALLEIASRSMQDLVRLSMYLMIKVHRPMEDKRWETSMKF